MQCGAAYGTTAQVIDMSELLAIQLATFALSRPERGEPLVAALTALIDSI